jgi:isoquinoline 1-oxidoreductase beta subunit
MATIQNVSRRSFLTALGIGGGGLVLGISLDRSTGLGFLTDAQASASFAPNVFLSIDGSGLVTIVAHRSEMGQGIRTSTTMIVADELEADWARVRVVQGEGNEKKYGDQNTDGSHSIRGALKPLREAGAAARMMLESAAAAKWKVPVSEVQARNHQVVHAASGRTLDYGALAAAAATQPVPAAASLRLKPKSAFRYIGKAKAIVDGGDIVTGRAIFGIDATLPGMKHAVIARPPVYGGKLVSVDSTEALKVPGVERVHTLEGAPPPSAFRPLGGVAVIARTTWAAMQGRDKLKLQWDDGPNASYDSAAYATALAATAAKAGKVARNEGDFDAALKAAAKVVTADYYAPHLTHSSIEPPAALADVTAGGCRVWACTQSPQGARDEVAGALGISADKVTVNVTLLGGAFGRKSKPDFIVEAALLSKAVGAPVKVTWTREDEIQNAYYHTVTAQHLEGALDASGKVTGWLHRTAFPSISSVFAPNVTAAGAGELGLGVVDVPFAIPNLRCEVGEARAHVRIGWFRSVSNIPHAFAVCSFVDELAAAAKKDPKEFLLELVGPARKVVPNTTEKYENYGASLDEYPIDTGRLRAVIEAAATKAGWGRKLPARRGLGIAAHRSFLSYVCSVVEVAVAPDGAISVPRVVTAIDCGTYVHPERIKSQLEGAAVMGISTALYGSITFKQGRTEQSNFDTYELARMSDAPGAIETILIESDAPPAGVGEPGLPVFAPALCNAIFAATGKRLRELPIGGKVKA